MVAVGRGRGLCEPVLRNKVTSEDDLRLDRYISSITSKLARGRGHLETARGCGSHSCGRAVSFDELHAMMADGDHAWTCDSTEFHSGKKWHKTAGSVGILTPK